CPKTLPAIVAPEQSSAQRSEAFNSPPSKLRSRAISAPAKFTPLSAHSPCSKRTLPPTFAPKQLTPGLFLSGFSYRAPSQMFPPTTADSRESVPLINALLRTTSPLILALPHTSAFFPADASVASRQS